MQQLRGDKLAMKAALDLILWCAYGNKSRAFPGGPPPPAADLHLFQVCCCQ